MLDAAEGPRQAPLQVIGRVKSTRNCRSCLNDAVVAGVATSIMLLETEEDDGHPLFPGAQPVPHRSPTYAIALRIAGLVKDGGTLQIGIGSLGDSHCLLNRIASHDTTAGIRTLLDCSRSARRGHGNWTTCHTVFTASSEMFVGGISVSAATSAS